MKSVIVLIRGSDSAYLKAVAFEEPRCVFTHDAKNARQFSTTSAALDYATHLLQKGKIPNDRYSATYVEVPASRVQVEART